jgi:hypothetical protein
MRTFLLPPGTPDPPVRFRQVGALELEYPETTPALAVDVASRLISSRPALAALRTEVIIRALDDAVAEWSAPGSLARRAAEDGFSAATGIPPETAPFLPLLSALKAPAIRDWAHQEVKPFGALERFSPAEDGAPVRAVGPRLAVHILPGNVPLVWLPTLAACLVMRIPCLVKPAADDPCTPALFAQSLAKRLPELAAALAVLPWTGGDAAVEEAALAGAEVVVVYGGDSAVRSLARRVLPGAKLLVHGPRYAAGAIGREIAAPGRIEAVAAAAARDVLLYDGRGCLSLTAVHVERGGLLEPAEIAEILGSAMERESTYLPPGRPDPDAAAVTQSWRARIRARALAGKPSALYAGPRGLDWTVLYDAELPAPGVPLVRTLWVGAVGTLDELPSRLGTSGGMVHALAFSGPESRRLELAERLAPQGLTRVCAFGRLQEPPLGWPHGGASPFKRLLDWVLMER